MAGSKFITNEPEKYLYSRFFKNGKYCQVEWLIHLKKDSDKKERVIKHENILSRDGRYIEQRMFVYDVACNLIDSEDNIGKEEYRWNLVPNYSYDEKIYKIIFS